MRRARISHTTRAAATRAHIPHRPRRRAAPQVSRDDLPAIFQKYGDDEFVMDLLEEFVREANTSLAVIETKDDARAVQSAAHRIKGSAGNLDLHSIRQIAEVVEVNAVSDGVEWPYRDGGGADEGDGEFDAVVRAPATLPLARAPAPCPPPAAHTPPRLPQVLLLKARVKRVADLLQLGAEQLKAGATDAASSATSSGKSSMASTD